MNNESPRREGSAARPRVISRSELEEQVSELQQQVTEFAAQRVAVSEVLRVIASSPHDLQPIFETMLASARRFCRADTSALRLCEEEGVRLVARKAPADLVKRWSPPILSGYHTFHGEMVNRSPFHVPDLAAHESYSRRDPIAVGAVEKEGVRTLLSVPLLMDEEVIGFIALARLQVVPFTNREIELVTDFAAEATIALQMTRRERQLREVQMELAHANRVATMGQLTASIAHEVNQPVNAVAVNAATALLWLARRPPDLEEAQQALGRIVKNANRAGDVLQRIRALVKKASSRKDRLEINEAILEVIALTRGELVRTGVSLQTQLGDDLPLVQSDRVQLQQVILNLIVNAVEAMSAVGEGTRELLISSGDAAPDGVLVAVRDSGPGLAPANIEHLFEAFYTTKPSGLRMGLSICRSIIEAHGGRLWATACQPHGALFQFMIPARPA